jgi:hypothetical protein
MNAWLRAKLRVPGNRNPWRVLWWRTLQRPAGRMFCLPRRHDHWSGRDTTLTALAGGRSKGCRYCNRLILKTPYREDAGWLRTTRGWIWSKG